MEFVEHARYALRQFRKALGFSTTAILTIALGIGATTAIFTLVHAVLLKSLPVVKPRNCGGLATRRIAASTVACRPIGRFSLLSNTDSSATTPRASLNWLPFNQDAT